jgi:hypothetical protein
MKRTLLISAASVAFASVAAAQDAAVALMPEVSGSAKAGNSIGIQFGKDNKVGSFDSDNEVAQYYDFDIDIAYTWGDFTATFNVDGNEHLTESFYTYQNGLKGIGFQLTYSDGGWDYTIGTNSGDTFVEADGSTGTFGYSNDIPSVFDTGFSSEVDNNGFLSSGSFAVNPGDNVNSTLLNDFGNGSEDLADNLNLGGNPTLDPDAAFLVTAVELSTNNTGDNLGNRMVENARGDNLLLPQTKSSYEVKDGSSNGVYFIAPDDRFGFVGTTVSGKESKPTITIGGFFETDFVTAAARITPFETVVNLSTETTLPAAIGGVENVTLELQYASHSFKNLLKADAATSFDRTGSSVGVSFDAFNASHNIAYEVHNKFQVKFGTENSAAQTVQTREQGAATFVSYDLEVDQINVHLHQGDRDSTDINGSIAGGFYLGGVQSGLVVSYDLSDDVTVGLGYAAMDLQDNAVSKKDKSNNKKRNYLDAGIKISF